jgi:hypothetical protein
MRAASSLSQTHADREVTRGMIDMHPSDYVMCLYFNHLVTNNC